MISPNTAGEKKCSCREETVFQIKSKKIKIKLFGPPAHLRLLVCGHAEEGEEDPPVEGALHVGHGRRGGQPSQVQASGGVTQVRVQAPLEGLVKHHLVEETGEGGAV